MFNRGEQKVVDILRHMCEELIMKEDDKKDSFIQELVLEIDSKKYSCSIFYQKEYLWNGRWERSFHIVGKIILIREKDGYSLTVTNVQKRDGITGVLIQESLNLEYNNLDLKIRVDAQGYRMTNPYVLQDNIVFYEDGFLIKQEVVDNYEEQFAEKYRVNDKGMYCCKGFVYYYLCEEQNDLIIEYMKDFMKLSTMQKICEQGMNNKKCLEEIKKYFRYIPFDEEVRKFVSNCEKIKENLIQYRDIKVLKFVVPFSEDELLQISSCLARKMDDVLVDSILIKEELKRSKSDIKTKSRSFVTVK